MDKPPYDHRLDRVCRSLREGMASERAATLEEAIEYGTFRARLLGVRQIVRPGSTVFGQGHRFWYSQSVR